MLGWWVFAVGIAAVDVAVVSAENLNKSHGVMLGNSTIILAYFR